jgi:hypothetical protein
MTVRASQFFLLFGGCLVFGKRREIDIGRVACNSDVYTVI